MGAGNNSHPSPKYKKVMGFALMIGGREFTIFTTLRNEHDFIRWTICYDYMYYDILWRTWNLFTYANT
jgi:hypothetical protein